MNDLTGRTEPMDERDALRYASRRAAFLRAVRDGDARGAARAGARLQLSDAPLAPSELARAREARRVLGRAIVNARLPRPPDAAPRHETPITAPRRSRRPLALIAAGMVLVLLIALFPAGTDLPGGGSPETAAAEQQRTTLQTVSRGRTIAAPVEVVVVIETPTPSPSPSVTPEPTEAPTPAPVAQASTPPATRGPGGAGASPSGPPGDGGNGSGNGGGNGNGQGRGSGTTSPRPTVTLGPVPSGFARMVIIVVDAQTRRPIADVCVVVGTSNCLPGQPHTDANGRWAADVAASSAVSYWDVSLIKPGYVSQSRRLSLPGGRSTTFQIALRRS
jgi:hypothetical protein